MTVIHGGSVIDGTGAAPINDGVVAFRGDRIVFVGSSHDFDIPARSRLIDAAGGTVMPGLIDSHTHAVSGTFEYNLLLWLKVGVTTFVDVGSAYGRDLSIEKLRDELAELGDSAPNILLTGPIITVPGSPVFGCCASQAIAVKSVEEATQLAQRLLSQGADGLKLLIENGPSIRSALEEPRNPAPVLSDEQILAIVEVAHREGTWVTAHVTDQTEAWRALRLGVDSLAHWPGGERELSDELIQEIVSQDVPVVTTSYIVVVRSESVRRFLDKGGIIVIGSDAGPSSTIREIQSMVNRGMTPMEVIVAATANAAHMLNLTDELGTLEVGKLADIIIVEGDPLSDIQVLNNLRTVVKGGQVVFPEDDN
jgi:imidazolonepropionase-like amidohydrolase